MIEYLPSKEINEQDIMFFRKNFEVQDKLLHNLQCSLWDGIFPKQGWMYISPQHICFYSRFLSQNIKISFNQLINIELENTSFNNYLYLITEDKKYCFSSFHSLSIEDTKEFLLEIKNIYVRQNIAIVETNNGLKEQMKIYSPNFKVPEKIVIGVEELKKNILAEGFEKLFRIPENETPLHEYNATFYDEKIGKIEGVIFLTSRFFCFTCYDAVLRVTLPLSEITSFTKENTNLLVGNAFKMSVLNTRFFFVVSYSERNTLFTNLENQWKFEIQRMEKLKEKYEDVYNEFDRDQHTDPLPEIFIKEQKFRDNYIDRQKMENSDWNKYMYLYNCDISMKKKLDHLSKLIWEVGIPDYLRGNLWQLISGSVYYMKVNYGYFHHLLNFYEGRKSYCTDDIEKDLHRSLPEHPFFQSEKGQLALKNVLVAYSWKNPKIGYCQGMNFLSSIFLLYMPQESTFWLLTIICEKLAPNFYRRAMIGSTLLQKILDYLVKKKLPRLHYHLEKINFTLSLITQSWFLTLFIGYVPLELALRIIDLFLLEGTPTLLRFALSVLLYYEDELLKIFDFSEFVMKMKRKLKCDIDKVISVARDIEIPENKIVKILSHASHNLLHEMRNYSKSSFMKKYSKITSFNEEELESFFENFVSHISGDIAYINFLQFKRFMPQIINWWDYENHYDHEFFNFLDQNGTGFVFMDEILSLVEILLKKNLRERFILCCNVFDDDKDNLLEKKQMISVLKVITKSFHQTNKIGIKFFVPSSKIETYVDNLMEKSVVEDHNTVEGKVSITFFLLKSVEEDGIQSYFELNTK